MSSSFTDRQMISRLFFRLLPIQILLALIAAINGLISGTLASNYIGSAAMSAIGLYAPLNMVITVISTVLLGGTQILCGKFMGRGRTDRTQQLFSTDIVFMLLAGALITAVFLVIPTPLANLLGANDETREHLTQYIMGSAVGIVPFLLSQQVAGFLTLERGKRRTSVASITYVAVSSGLAVLFVAVLKMGAFGLALGNSLGFWVFALILIQFYFTKRAILRFKLTGFRWGDLGQAVRMGFPGALTNAYQVIRGYLVNSLFLATLGNDGLAAVTAYNNVGGLFWAFPAGVIAVGRLLSSVAVGEEDRQALRNVMATALFKGGALVLGTHLLLSVLAVPLTQLFYHDPALPVYEMTVVMFRFYPASMALSCAVVLFINCAQAVGRPVLVQLLGLGDGLVNVTLFCWLTMPTLGVLGFALANYFNGVVNLLIVFFFAWAVHRRPPKKLTDLLALKPGFGVPPDQRMDLMLSRTEDVTQTAQAVQAFCLEQGIDPRRAYFAGLCLEEMAANVLEHGFEKDTRRHLVNVSVVRKEEDLILRIKDDCVPFNPEERRQLADPEDPMKGAGIRLVYGIAREVNYQNMLGLNVLTIRI